MEKPAEIGGKSGLKENYIRTNLARTRIKLKKFIEEDQK